MADLAKIKRNVAKMASMNAPEEDIDGYISSEGVTVDQVRNFKQIQPTSTQTINQARGKALGLPGFAATEQKIANRPPYYQPILDIANRIQQGDIRPLMNPQIDIPQAVVGSAMRGAEMPIAAAGVGIQTTGSSPFGTVGTLPGMVKEDVTNPNGIIAQVAQSLAGKRNVELGDIMRNVGAPEPIAAATGGLASLGLMMPGGVAKTAGGMATGEVWGKAGQELAMVGKGLGGIGQFVGKGFGKVYTKAKAMLNAGKDLTSVQKELANQPFAQLELRNAVRDARTLKNATLSDIDANFKAKNQELANELKKETQLQSGANKLKIKNLAEDMSITYRNGLNNAEDALAQRGVTINPSDYKNVIDKTIEELQMKGMPEDNPAFSTLLRIKRELSQGGKTITVDLSKEGENVYSIIKKQGGIAPYNKGTGSLATEYSTNVPFYLRNNNGLKLDDMAALLKEKYPNLGIESESDLLNYLSKEKVDRLQGQESIFDIDMTKPLSLSELKNFKNKVYETISSGVRSGSRWADADDQVANIFLKNHGSYLERLSPELSALNKEFAPMANARAWAAKTFRPFNDSEIQRGANVLERIAKSETPNQTDINYLRVLEEGSGRFKGAGSLKGKTTQMGEYARGYKKSFDMAKKNLIDSTDLKINQLQTRMAELQKRGIGLRQNEEKLKDLIRLRRRILAIGGAGVIFGGANAGRRIVYNVANQ